MENDLTIIFGAGPAGLAAAYELTKNNKKTLILEKEWQIGGIAKTINHQGNLYDIGPHRFFTKNSEVLKLWQSVLKEKFKIRPRLTRIYYQKKYFYYPLKPVEAFIKIGVGEAINIFFDYLLTRLKYYFGQKKKPENYQDWMIQKFGKRLFNIFFRTYTEKVWGISTHQIGAEWATQRIKGLSLSKAIINSFFPKNNKIKSLINEFYYPDQGAGMMSEKIGELIKQNNGVVVTNAEVKQIAINGNMISKIVYRHNNTDRELTAGHYLSSMPLNELINKITPAVSEDIYQANSQLKFRSLILVCLVINQGFIFSDNWLYINNPEVKVARITNFKNWSEKMVKNDQQTTLVGEYFCFEDDETWSQSDSELIDLAKAELIHLGLVKSREISSGLVVRQKDAYPVYQIGYQENLERVIEYVKTIKNLQIIGRGGTFRYNNMDHSVLMGLMAARNIMGGSENVLNINVDEEYQEIKN